MFYCNQCSMVYSREMVVLRDTPVHLIRKVLEVLSHQDGFYFVGTLVQGLLYSVNYKTLDGYFFSRDYVNTFLISESDTVFFFNGAILPFVVVARGNKALHLYSRVFHTETGIACLYRCQDCGLIGNTGYSDFYHVFLCEECNAFRGC